MSAGERCECCVYRDVDEIQPTKYYICRRWPPVRAQAGMDFYGIWPRVRDDDWCGEFEMKLY